MHIYVKGTGSLTVFFTAGSGTPYLLVGHSLASLEVIRFAQLFPGEVFGIVLIDGGNPEFYADHCEVSVLFFNRLLKGLQITGLARILGSTNILIPVVGGNL